MSLFSLFRKAKQDASPGDGGGTGAAPNTSGASETSDASSASTPQAQVWVEEIEIYRRLPDSIRAKERPPKPNSKVWIDLASLENRVSHRKTTVPVALLRRYAPHLFSPAESDPVETLEVEFPWAHIAYQLATEPRAVAPSTSQNGAIEPQPEFAPPLPGLEYVGKLPIAELRPDGSTGTAIEVIYQELERVTMQRDAATSLKDAMAQDLQRVRESTRRQVETLQNRLAELEQEYRNQIATLRAENRTLADSKREIATQLTSHLDDHRRALAEKDRELEMMRTRVAQADQIIEREKQAVLKDVDSIRVERENLIATSEELARQLIQTKENARKQIESVTEQFDRRADETRVQLESVIAERDRLRQERTAALESLAALEHQWQKFKMDSGSDAPHAGETS